MIDGLDGIDEINFCCHSLGNLIVRRYLGEASSSQNRGGSVDSRIKRMVMLGPPNNGARLARSDCRAASRQRAGAADRRSQRLAACPRLERGQQAAGNARAFAFGILAGGQGDSRGLNPLVYGDDDLVVASKRRGCRAPSIFAWSIAAMGD